MSKQFAVMPSLQVIVERLPNAVIDSVMSSPENVAMKSMPFLRVTLERLPKNVMIKLLAQKKKLRMAQEKKVEKPKKTRSCLYKYNNAY